MDAMLFMAFTFSILGLVFGIMAYSMTINSRKRLDRIESQLNESGK